MSTPWELDRGVHQQRIPSTLAEGAYAFEMGHALHADVNLLAGDHHDLTQSFIIVEQANLIRLRVRLAAPPVLPAGMTWRFSAWLNAVQHYSRSIDVAGRTVVLDDVVIRMYGIYAFPVENELLLRLELV